MSPRRRTLLFVFVLISAKNGFGSSVLSELPPGFKGGTPPSANNFFKATSPSELIAAAQRLLPGSQRQLLNEVITQAVNSEPSPIRAGPPFQKGSSNIEPIKVKEVNIESITNIPSNAQIITPVITPEVVQIEALPTTSPMTTTPIYSAQTEYSVPVEQNSLSGRIPLGPVLQTLSLPDSFYANSFGSSPDPPQYYQSPITVKVPPSPIVSPITTIAAPTPTILPLNVPSEFYTPEYYPRSINMVEAPFSFPSAPINVQEVSSIFEPAPIMLPNGCGSNSPSFPGYNSQLPLNLQINVPTPSPSEQPIIFISPPSPAPVARDSSLLTQLVMPPPPMVPPAPIIVSGRSRNRWRNILPILLIALCDGGCQNGGDCCSGGGNIPIPYPIPIPTNNPVIVNRGKKKGSTTVSSATGPVVAPASNSTITT